MLDVLELKLVIRKQGAEYVAVTESGNGLPICTNTFQHDATEPMPLEVHHSGFQREPASRLIRNLIKKKHRDPVTSQFAQYGTLLYQYAFGNGRKLRDYLRTQIGYQRVRLNIVLKPSAMSLSRLPWEYLYNGKVFLGGQASLHIVRQAEKITPALRPTQGPLRILALISSPYDQPPLDMENMVANLQHLLELSKANHQIELDILNEITPYNLYHNLQRKFYHILYFIGYGKVNLDPQHSYLCFEDDVGNTEFVGAAQLKKITQINPPHLLIIKGLPATSHKAGGNPFSQFSLECVLEGISAVVNLPNALRGDSTTIFTKSLISELSSGEPVSVSVQTARRVLYDQDDQQRENKQFDWGFPVYYSGAEWVQPVLSEVPPDETAVDVGNQETDRFVPVFIDRRSELHSIRTSLKQNISVIYMWGHQGVGKRSLLDQLIYHAGVQFKGILRLNCYDIREPLSVISRIANFWAGHKPETHQQAADLLLDPRQDPFVRAQAAQKHIGTHRYLIVFENIDAWFTPQDPYMPVEEMGNIGHPLIRSILLGLLHAESNTTFLFTGMRRWADLADIPGAARREFPLPLLKPIWAYQLMSSCSGSYLLSR
ncbi:MAG: CHAT domain-containing protein, partial [Anaerolineae bacterium]|nr:CHAT domain-containing protein [Anaerolineae bacterium]